MCRFEDAPDTLSELMVPVAVSPPDTSLSPPESAVSAVSHVIPDTPAPKEECALEIIRAGALRRREVLYPARPVGTMLLLRSIAPELLDSLIRGSYRLENVRRT